MLTLASMLAACDHHAPNPKLAGSSPGVYDAGADTCPATCSTPAGTVRTFHSDADTWAALIGVWQICSGAYSMFADAPADTIGVEFALPHTDLPYDAAATRGNMYFLTRGQSGLARGGGFEYQQTYEVVGGWLNCYQYYDSGYAFRPTYSPCPREWKLDDGGQVALLVPL